MTAKSLHPPSRHGRRYALIGNSLPRRCGIATFTTDLQNAIASPLQNTDAVVVAMNDAHEYDYPSSVGFQIQDDQPESYQAAAAFLNANEFDAVSLQHEFGIFGGEAGEYILPLIESLEAPLVTTLHTILAQPSSAQRDVLQRIVAASARVVVMAQKGRQMLRDIYQTPASKIEVIAHGVPDYPFVEPDRAKAELALSGRPVILTFGLLSPSKGIEVMIDAMASIISRLPNAVYVVLGATHPSLVRREGEAYRERLMARARALGVENNVVFVDQFVDRATLLSYISACDVYVTPYLNEAQMTSGTLAYSYALGKAVVSTPYWHARELLGDGGGILVPFLDAAALSNAITGLLTDDDRRLAIRRHAYAASRFMTWERTGESYRALFESVRRERFAAKLLPLPEPAVTRLKSHSPPEVQLHHLLSMCDDTGLCQHAVHCVPDRAHGYCVDDNARALLLASALRSDGEERLPDMLTARFAAFVQHAWNPETRRFRNFMSFDRRWLEAVGSEDSHGRTLWALGATALLDSKASRRSWAGDLFARALANVESFTSPRAWAFTLLGLNAYCAANADDVTAGDLRTRIANKLEAIFVSVESKDWTWFETGLTYENARLSQALIETGRALSSRRHLAAGLNSLRWLMSVQTTSEGLFRPIGTEGFGAQREAPMAFDQQPVEAAATISACLSAARVDGDTRWNLGAARAFAWFHGANDLAMPLVDVASGGCRDGLHADRVNENQGAESVLSYLLGLVEIRSAARARAGWEWDAHALRA